MAALKAASSIFSSFPYTSSISPLRPKTSSLHFLRYTLTLSLKFPLLSSSNLPRKSKFEVCTAAEAVQETEVEEERSENTQPQEAQRRKLFVVNLPWSFTVSDIKTLFGECGTVTDVEIIKQRNGKSRGFAFVTMASGEEGQAVIEKFNSHELSSRIIRIEFAKRFKKPSPPPPTVERRHMLYVSNLSWKVRSPNLREFFAANFSPVAARVVFDSPSGRAAGYGFVSFATREEAETAIAELNGKELLGRPVILKFSQKSVKSSESKEENSSEGQPEEL